MRALLKLEMKSPGPQSYRQLNTTDWLFRDVVTVLGNAMITSLVDFTQLAWKLWHQDLNLT